MRYRLPCWTVVYFWWVTLVQEILTVDCLTQNNILNKFATLLDLQQFNNVVSADGCVLDLGYTNISSDV